eukprot:CAMPEP_0172523374 /NCGR_PEP_ID=MMETSP1066-20121228/293629_1 /TAXON_ID=671091 /ORGANISM="Coscinodiscus wailesii, Strain CCMP2513" /LENGTH=157 /DNA_ID=CAMNT_0013306445 /DNA_START=686 /DNA_END=1157 /DNA_ORIENTATION=+
MTREEFFNFPWNDYIEAKNGEKEFTYSNVFELRRHKLDIMKQIMDAVPHRVVVVHLNVVERAPEFLIRDLVKQFNLDLAPNYVVQNQSKHAHSTLCLNNSEWKVAQENIDWDIEALFGTNVWIVTFVQMIDILRKRFPSGAEAFVLEIWPKHSTRRG